MTPESIRHLYEISMLPFGWATYKLERMGWPRGDAEAFLKREIA